MSRVDVEFSVTVQKALARAKTAVAGHSNDDEHDALYALVRALDPEFE